MALACSVFAYLDCLSVLMTKAMLCHLFCSLTSVLNPHAIRTPQIPHKTCITLGQLMIYVMVDINLLSLDNALAEGSLSCMHGLCLIILAHLFLILRQVSNAITMQWHFINSCKTIWNFGQMWDIHTRPSPLLYMCICIWFLMLAWYIYIVCILLIDIYIYIYISYFIIS